MSEQNYPSAFDDFVRGLDELARLTPGRAERLAERIGGIAGTLAGRWAKAPATHRMMAGYIVGAIVGTLIRRLIIWQVKSEENGR